LPKVFSDDDIILIPPAPPLRKWGNYKEVLVKLPFEKEGFRANAVHLIGEISRKIIYPVILRE
jgi:hypothetical protein